MSGIVGAWNIDGRPLDPEVLYRMSAAIRHRGPDGEGRHVAGSIGFACQHLWATPEDTGETQPVVGPSGVMLVMDGRLDNRDELLPALGLPPSASDAACALAAYERWEERFAERLNGDFALALFDAAKRQFVLARDAIGIRPLYFFHNVRLFVFASEIKALLAHPDIPCRPDDEGVADFMFVSSRPLDRQDVTCFAGVAAVVPAHLVVVTANGIVSRRYWDFDTGRAIRLRSFDEYAEAFRERFAEAVRRRIRSVHPVAVSVSGGLDSSSIFCQAETLRRTGDANCLGVAGLSYTGAAGTGADERRYLQEIESEYSVEIERFPIEPLTGLVNGTDQQIRANETPFLDYMWGVTRALHRRARAQGARVLLSGHWGDQVLFSSAYLVDLFDRFAWGEIRRHTKEYERWLSQGEVRVLKRRFVVDVARHHAPRALVPPLKWLRRRLLRGTHPKSSFSAPFLRRALQFANRPSTAGDGFHSAHARALYLEARSKYHVQCMEWNNKIGALHGLDAAFPFLDRDLLAFLMAVPGDVQNRNGVPRALLREAMQGVLPEPVRARTWKADLSAFVNSGVAQDAGAISRALGPASLGVRLGHLDAARLALEVARIGSRLEGPECTNSWDLADLYGLEMWLQVFFNPVNSAPVPRSHEAQENAECPGT
jgi:asparagine synthase (glutamine-hydrolysing)